MSEQQATYLVIFGPVLILVAYALYEVSLGSHKRNFRKAKESIDKFVIDQSGNSESIKYYTLEKSGFYLKETGCWEEIPYNKVLEIIKADSWLNIPSSGVSIGRKPQFLLSYNTDKNAVHIVLTKEKAFDWSAVKYPSYGNENL